MSLFLGGAGAHFKSKQPNLSARIGVTSLSRGAGAMLKQPNLSARIGVKVWLLQHGASTSRQRRYPNPG